MFLSLEQQRPQKPYDIVVIFNESQKNCGRQLYVTIYDTS